MNIPGDLYYTKDHEWLLLNGTEAIIGITDFAQGELGDIVYVDVDKVGEILPAGEAFGTVEAVKTVSDLFLPVSGAIVSVNPDLKSNPELINTDPYNAGWIIKLQIGNVLEIDSLMSASDYEKLVR